VYESDLKAALERALRKLGYSAVGAEVTPPKEPSHGDAATTLALGLAKREGRNPRELAQAIVDALEFPDGFVESVEIAGPGFINFRFAGPWYDRSLREIVRQGGSYGHTDVLAGKRIQVEFVSANPTGPLNVVSARAAAVGDAIASLLEACGAEVGREFYVNDAGQQVAKLALSVEARIREIRGEPCRIPEGGYQGEYLKGVAAQIDAEHPDVLDLPDDERVKLMKREAVDAMVAEQKRGLSEFGVEFDRWFHESELATSGEVDAALERLKGTGETYDQDGALWLRTTPHGTNDDKVLVKQDGVPTYLLPDVAYHLNKFERGFDPAITLLGPDHHAHGAEMHAALDILGFPKERLEIQIIQQVNFVEGGQKLKMSKREGKIVTLPELVADVGVDVAKFFFLMRKQTSHLDFDLDLAREQGEENPVFYVQYAHARVASLIRFGVDRGAEVPSPDEVDLSDVTAGEARPLVLLLAEFPGFVERSALAREPHRLTTYLRDVSSRFHSYYHDHRIVTEDSGTTAARLFLSEATRTVLANGLALLGVAAPERM